MKHPAIAITIVVTLFGSTSAAVAQTRAPGQVNRQAAPPGWSEVVRQILDLTLAGKQAESIAILEQWVARYPNFVDAQQHRMPTPT